MVTFPAKANTKSAALPLNAPFVTDKVISPVVAALIVFNCATLGASLIVTVPVCSVTFPANANTKSAAFPVNAPFVTPKVISPVVPALIVFNCATLGASLIVIAPELFIDPANAIAKSAAVPL